MNIISSILCSGLRALALGLFFVAASHGFAQALGERATVPGDAYTVRPPDGWKIEKNTEKKSLHATSTDGSGFNLQARDIEYPGTVKALIDVSMEGVKEMNPSTKVLDSEPFKTKSGLEGTLVHIELTVSGVEVRQMLFFLNGKAGHKIFFCCGFPKDADSKKTRAFYEEVASTIRLD